MSLTPASDIVGKKPGRRLTGLLLVAIPVLLVCWMVIWPILSAIWRTVWIKNDGGTGSSFSLETYRFFFTEGVLSCHKNRLGKWRASLGGKQIEAEENGEHSQD